MELLQNSPWWVATLLIISILAECYQSSKPNRRPYGTVGLYQNAEVSKRSKFDSQPKLHFVKQSAEPNIFPRPRSVLVKCHEDSLEVVVKADLFDTGVLVDGKDLHLGSGFMSEKGTEGTCGAVPSEEAEFTIYAHLTDCGTQLSSAKKELVYSNMLIYSPAPSPDGVFRLDGTAIPIECHYGKRYAVDSAPLLPTWMPFTSTVTAEDQLDFSLRLMMDDWQSERGTNVYFLGDIIHLEAAVIMRNHMPLRVYVDHCVATVTPDADTNPKHDFIEYNGCFTDAQLTGSRSQFMPRVQDDKLHIVLDAFRFHQAVTHLIYITCYLKAVPAMFAVNSLNRACSFTENSWWSAEGNDQVCRTCEVSKRFEEPTRAPTTTKKSTNRSRAKQDPASYLRVLPGQSREQVQQTQLNKLPSPYTGVWKRGTDSKQEWSKTTLLGPLIVLPAQEVITLTTVSTTVLPTTIPAKTIDGTVAVLPNKQPEA